jgi:hypothetical protein
MDGDRPAPRVPDGVRRRVPTGTVERSLGSIERARLGGPSFSGETLEYHRSRNRIASRRLGSGSTSGRLPDRVGLAEHGALTDRSRPSALTVRSECPANTKPGFRWVKLHCGQTLLEPALVPSYPRIRRC